MDMSIFKKILVTEEQIKKEVERLGREITEDYRGKELVVIGMLKGCAPFFVDLIKRIDLDIKIDFMQISSFHGGLTATFLELKKDIDIDIVGKHVLIVDDIIDTARTCREVAEMFKNRNAASIEFACFLDKPAGRKVEFDPKYIGTTVENEFVVGYGLDYDEKYRNLPFIGVLKEEMYK